MAAIKVLFFGTVMALLMDGVFSNVCTLGLCAVDHPQTQFCNSDYVFRGKIVSRTPVYANSGSPDPTSMQYQVMPTHVFRATGDRVQKDVEVTVITAGYDRNCGLFSNMIVKEAYLISAKVISGNVVTFFCSWNSVFAAVTPSQRKMLREEKYKIECSRTPPCEVRPLCPAQEPSDCPQFDGCTFNSTDCNVEHAFCTRQNGQCQWSSYTKRHTTCMSLQNPRQDP